MGNRLSKIYTRTGDDGSTGLGDGSRTGKDSLRVTAYGTVDELNSAIGMTMAADGVDDDIREALVQIQHELFDLGGDWAIPAMPWSRPATSTASRPCSTPSTRI